MRFSPGVALQYLIPQKLSGRFVYRLSRSERPWLKNLLIAGFKRLYHIDAREAAISDRSGYVSFNAFFTRALKDGARPIMGDADTIASPVDGTVTEFGRLDHDRLLQAKGRSYSVQALLSERKELLAPFEGGQFLTIYLAPRDYHRVHTPVAGQLDRARYIPGRRFAVNLKTAAAIENLFCRNERVALWLSTPTGYAVLVMIGALNVSSLTTALTGEIESGAERLISPAAPPTLARGDELGRFNLGSTVVLLFPRDVAEWNETLEPGQAIRMGEPLGRIAPRSRT
jgi:phosphatidylserine decarboxylase